MDNSHLIIVKVQYERSPASARSLRWIAPELEGAGLTLVEDQIDDERPSRTWTGTVDRPTFERFAQAWRLRSDGDEHGLRGFYVFDGMNWNAMASPRSSA